MSLEDNGEQSTRWRKEQCLSGGYHPQKNGSGLNSRIRFRLIAPVLGTQSFFPPKLSSRSPPLVKSTRLKLRGGF